MKNVCVIGGGVAGVMCAIIASRNGANVTLLEKNEKLLKKMFITGKGRCNLTNYCDTNEFMQNIVSNPRFMFSPLAEFDSYSTYSFFSDLGVMLKIERGNRVFPESDKSSDITKVFEKGLVQSGATVKLNCKVSEIEKQGDGFVVLTSNGKMQFDKVVVATGGFTYKATGSTGDGYAFGKGFGHNIIKPVPALCGLVCFCKNVDFAELSGLTLKNVSVSATVEGKKVYENFGELLFTHNGVSGPTVLSLSSFINRVDLKKVKIYIDLKPALSVKQLDERVQRDFKINNNKAFKNSLYDLLPKSLAEIIVKKSGISENKQVNQITSVERENLVNLIKNFDLEVRSFVDANGAIISAGGIDVKEINPKTMESKIVKSLYFAGEVIDVDALTGGFNIQIALSTGYVAGINVCL